MLGNRSLDLVARNVFRRQNYLAMARMVGTYRRPAEGLWRYTTGRGAYPVRWHVRTPLGVVSPTVYGHPDFVTVTEMFCRLDYRAPDDVGVVVDIGSNIGISALYFLTRNAHSRCYLYEPVPQNVERLRGNLEGYEARYEIAQTAVWDRDGTVTFGTEASGRYGGIGVASDAEIEVEVRDINTVLESVLEHEDAIDILKVDTEGTEVATIRAIRDDLLSRVRVIYLEAFEDVALHPARMEAHSACDTMRLTHRG